MKLSSVSQTKNQLSALLEQVRQGETVVITDHDRPVAKITAMASDDAVGLHGDIEWLERNGIIRRGGGGGFYALKPPVVPTQGCSALAALLDERRTGR
ncbi:MAG: type II toxin-antitoxin system prevent-host-death family antitoxin [Sulfuritalea sp.]|nr:type II toxin-antitoxin system prevent-host-death family antitoxin [Sulfuritalea sp.]